MGRYSSVQSYADNNPTMRTISHEQATGTSASQSSCTATNTSPNDTADRSEVENPPSSQLSDEAGSAAAGEQQQQVKQSAVLCETNCLFVGGLHPRIADVHLQKLFKPYGKIDRINVVTHPNNTDKSTKTSAKYGGGSLQQSKGYAFVEYSSVESARLAISRLNGRQLMGRSLAVRPSRKKMAEIARASKDAGKGETVEEARREYSAVQSKIEAVKRAIEEKKKGI